MKTLNKVFRSRAGGSRQPHFLERDTHISRLLFRLCASRNGGRDRHSSSSRRSTVRLKELFSSILLLLLTSSVFEMHSRRVSSSQAPGRADAASDDPTSTLPANRSGATRGKTNSSNDHEGSQSSSREALLRFPRSVSGAAAVPTRDAPDVDAFGFDVRDRGRARSAPSAQGGVSQQALQQLRESRKLMKRYGVLRRAEGVQYLRTGSRDSCLPALVTNSECQEHAVASSSGAVQDTTPELQPANATTQQEQQTLPDASAVHQCHAPACRGYTPTRFNETRGCLICLGSGEYWRPLYPRCHAGDHVPQDAQEFADTFFLQSSSLWSFFVRWFLRAGESGSGSRILHSRVMYHS
ncbi:unnamed protein product [Amoebophrya sp. A25]|nr:unnamed protein product [Amoebophrya sp. A25]|eukprot:GSA25T00013332001.1